MLELPLLAEELALEPPLLADGLALEPPLLAAELEEPPAFPPQATRTRAIASARASVANNFTVFMLAPFLSMRDIALSFQSLQKIPHLFGRFSTTAISHEHE